MVYMKLSLDISSSTNIRQSIYNHDPDETSTVGSHDSGNGFDLNNDDQVTDLVFSFVRKFLDKICDGNFVRQDLILPRFSSSRSTIRRTTVTALTSTISLPVSSNLNENNLNINE
ncbi:unnamed protein product [Rotaria sp. Silwood1]|nr:unnamed protein product [Rotaria sp. Silwood1]